MSNSAELREFVLAEFEAAAGSGDGKSAFPRELAALERGAWSTFTRVGIGSMGETPPKRVQEPRSAAAQERNRARARARRASARAAQTPEERRMLRKLRRAYEDIQIKAKRKALAK
jgi:hypothetical protein